MYKENAGLNINAVNTNEDGSHDIGLMQINDEGAGKDKFFGLDMTKIPWQDNWAVNIVAGAAYYAYLYYNFAISEEGPLGYGYERGSIDAHRSAYSMYNGGMDDGDRFNHVDPYNIPSVNLSDNEFLNWMGFWSGGLGF